MQAEANEQAFLVAVFGGESHSRRTHHAGGARRSGEFEDLAPSDSPLFLWLPSSKQEATDPRLGSAETSSR